MESSSQTTVCFSHPNRTLVVMAKAPKPGMVKTRLTESLPSPAVTALYRCLLEDTIALATSLTSVEDLGLSTGFTEPFYDIDIANDLIQLGRELRLAPTKAPRTAAWFNEWEQAVAHLR